MEGGGKSGEERLEGVVYGHGGGRGGRGSTVWFVITGWKVEVNFGGPKFWREPRTDGDLNSESSGPAGAAASNNIDSLPVPLRKHIHQNGFQSVRIDSLLS